MKTAMLKSFALATTVASLFAAATIAPAYAAGTEASVKCEKSSACKGQGACKTTTNACKGQNACKSQGMTEQKNEEACKDAQQHARDLLDKSNKSS